MSQSAIFFSNIVIPCLSVLFLLVYIFYFSVSHYIKSSSLRLFQLFLIFFTLFLIGRPLQLLLGPYPNPLIIVNIRVFILCSVVAPIIILTSDILDDKKHNNNIWIFAICILLGIIYVVFNILGTSNSYILFNIYGLTAYDNLTPSMSPPYYGREITLIAQTSIGIILFVFSVLRIFRLVKQKTDNYFFFKKNIFINLGILIFALSFIVGSVLKQWWIYYVTSIIITVLFGGSVLYDIKELNIFHERTLPLLKNEIISRLYSNDVVKDKITEILSCLGKNNELNCVVLIQLKSITEDRIRIVLNNKLEEVLERQLLKYYQDKYILILPIFSNNFIILVRLDRSNDDYKTLEIFEKIGEQIRNIINKPIIIGIGSIKTDIEYICDSFYEAMHAKKYAENNNIEGVVYYSNITQIEKEENPYPYREKQLLIDKIKIGDVYQIEIIVEDYLSKVKKWSFENIYLMKLKSYEIIGSLLNIMDGKNEDKEKLNEIVEKSFKRISSAKEVLEIERIIKEMIQTIVNIVIQQYQRRKNLYISKAKEYIEKKYRHPINFKKVAEYIGVSPSYFLHLFKKETGVTFVEYLTNYRINMAKKYLLEDKLNITEIAYEVGFSNSNYFSYVFRKIVGISAKDFKKKFTKINDSSPISSAH